MKTIGIIGGMSWESSVPYYRLINEGVRERLGGLHSARIAMLSVDFHDIAELQNSGRWDEAGEAMVDAVATWDDNESYWLNDPYWIEDDIEQEFMENGLVESDLGGMLFEEEDGNWYETFAPVKTSSGAPAGGIGLYMKANDLVERLEALNTWMILAFIVIVHRATL